MKLGIVIVLWFEAAICACIAGLYAVSGTAMAEDPVKILVVHTKAILLGFMPWLVAYAGTRVLFGFRMDLLTAWRECCGGKETE